MAADKVSLGLLGNLATELSAEGGESGPGSCRRLTGVGCLPLSSVSPVGEPHTNARSVGGRCRSDPVEKDGEANCQGDRQQDRALVRQLRFLEPRGKKSGSAGVPIYERPFRRKEKANDGKPKAWIAIGVLAVVATIALIALLASGGGGGPGGAY